MANKASPLVSIVVRTHNRAHLLKSALQCLLNQTYRPIEILVIDHNSTDQTEDVALSFGKHIRYFKHTGNFRDTFNVWRDKIKGHFISFLDDDDYVKPSCIEKLVTVLLSRKDIDLVFPRHLIYYLNGNRCTLLQETHMYDLSQIRKLILRWNIIPWNGVLFRTHCLSSIPVFDDTITGAFDWFFWTHLVLAGYSFYQLNEVLGVLRRSSDSVQLELARMSEGGLQCIRHYARHLSFPEKLSFGYHNVYGYRLIRHGIILIENGQTRKGQLIVLKGLWIYFFCKEGRGKFIAAILILLASFLSNPTVARTRVEKLLRNYYFRNYYELPQFQKTTT